MNIHKHEQQQQQQQQQQHQQHKQHKHNSQHKIKNRINILGRSENTGTERKYRKLLVLKLKNSSYEYEFKDAYCIYYKCSDTSPPRHRWNRWNRDSQPKYKF